MKTKFAAAPGTSQLKPLQANGDANFMSSLARGLSVIRAFPEQRNRVTIAELSSYTGISRAAVRRCLYTLVQLGYVSYDGKAFSLLPSVLSLGRAYLASNPFAQAAQPVLDRVSAAVHESCSLAVLQGTEILYVARSFSARRIMSVDLRVGSRLPAYCTSMGRVLLAGLPPAALNDYLNTVELKAYTPRTITSRKKLAAKLDQVRRQGYALVDQELELGLRSIAVPVKDQFGKVAAAMNIGAQANRVSIEKMKSYLLPHLLSAAAELGTSLMY